MFIDLFVIEEVFVDDYKIGVYCVLILYDVWSWNLKGRYILVIIK